MRLIDADKLTELCDIMAEKCDGIGESVWHQFRITVEWSPTVDAVPVVRCKDCIHYYTNTEIGYPNCEMLKGRFIVKDDWFCADGMRKDGAGEQNV